MEGRVDRDPLPAALGTKGSEMKYKEGCRTQWDQF